MMGRLFLAVPVRLYDYERIRELFSPLLEGRWSDEHQMHMTIAFFGEGVEPSYLLQSLERVDLTFHPSELTNYDYFKRSRVLVAMSDNETLQELYGRIASVLYLPPATLALHATLARVKKIVEPDVFFDLIGKTPDEPIGILEPKVALYKSVLYPDGAQYEILREWHV